MRLADYKKRFMDGSSLLKSGESSQDHHGQVEYYGEEIDEEEEKSLGQIL